MSLTLTEGKLFLLYTRSTMSLVNSLVTAPPPMSSSPVIRPQQAVISGMNNLSSGTITMSTNSSVISVSHPAPVSTHNSISTSLSVNLLPPDTAQVHQVLTKQKLQDLVREVDSNVQTDEETDELLLQLAEEFIDDVVSTSCSLAKHRKSSSLEVKDVQLSLEKNWNMWIPGFGCEELRPYKKSSMTEAHKQRMALIRKTLKK
ncbi:hypothetical protein JTE90_004275 [Oedothorax gibbosus]|uniref:Transcription initiation factor TFIID subunit 12 n=1 Tax=Oedothorax gibbosus TaxID=931172 RepID=A0AAV6U2W8_9ARAC|nr:hypothetical protein JTE90_004275 [Oedothorax gibbosus]